MHLAKTFSASFKVKVKQNFQQFLHLQKKKYDKFYGSIMLYKSDQFFMLVCVHMQMGVFCCCHIIFKE